MAWLNLGQIAARIAGSLAFEPLQCARPECQPMGKSSRNAFERSDGARMTFSRPDKRDGRAQHFLVGTASIGRLPVGSRRLSIAGGLRAGRDRVAR